MHIVFLDRQTFSPNIDLSALNLSQDKLTIYPTTLAEHVITRCSDADIILTNKVVLDRQTLEKLPTLKLICITATGINNVDIDAAKSLDIAVTNVSGYAQNSVTQYIFAQLLSYFSQVESHNDNTANGLWQKSETFCLHGNGSIELAGKTLGIIGFGSLGQHLAHIANAFGMKVLVAERAEQTTPRPNRLPFKDVILQADILSLHCPLTEDTKGLFNLDIFKAMKSNAVLINTARGGLINNVDLLTALNTQQIAYAILDVLEQEPPPEDHILLAQPSNKLKITAHIAWASIEAQQALLNLVSKNIIAFKENKALNRVD